MLVRVFYALMGRIFGKIHLLTRCTLPRFIIQCVYGNPTSNSKSITRRTSAGIDSTDKRSVSVVRELSSTVFFPFPFEMFFSKISWLFNVKLILLRKSNKNKININKNVFYCIASYFIIQRLDAEFSIKTQCEYLVYEMFH